MKGNNRPSETETLKTEPPALLVPGMGSSGGNVSGDRGETKARLFDSSIVSTPQEAVDFITNILESSTEYSVIGKDLTGKILLWNEGARRLYGYEPEEVVGKNNSSILHVPEDVESGVPKKIMEAALTQGKWEGTSTRRRKNGEQFAARVVITPRYGPSKKPTGFLLMSKIFRVKFA